MKLAAYLEKHGILPAKFAADLGVSDATVSRYINGHRYPREQHLRRISEMTGRAVTPNDFLAPAPSRSVEPAEAAA